ncbi:MAG: MFS transporter [Candidatus Aminicenantales bacterium]
MAKNRFLTLLSRVAEVKPGEELITLLFFLYFFFITASYGIIKSLRVAHYLEKEGSERLPLAYFITAVFTGLVVALHSRLSHKVKRHILTGSSLLFFTLTCFLFWLTFPRDWAWLPLAYWVWANILAVLLVTQFWLQVNDTFNPREAKRLIGFFGSGGILGGIIGGELTGLLAKSEVSSNLLLLACAFLAGCVFIIHSIFLWERTNPAKERKPEGKPKEKGPEPPAEGFKACLDSVRKSRYLTLLAGSVVIALIVSTLIDWQFSHTIEHTAFIKRNMTSFLGHFNAGLLFFSFLFQLFLTPRLIKFLGVRPAILIYPGILLVCSLGIGAVPGVLFALLIKGSDKSLHYSLDQSIHKLFYIPVTPEVKHRAELFIDMFLDRLAKGAGAGILAVFFLFGLGIREVSVLSVGLILVWIFLNIKVSHEYTGTVKQKVKLKWGRADKAVAEKVDLDYAKLVFDTLESKNRSSVLYAMHLFDLIRQDKLTPEIKKLIAQESSEMRISSLGSLFEAEGTSLVPETEETLSEDVLKKEVGEIMSLDIYQELMKKHMENILTEKSEESVPGRMEMAKVLGLMDPQSPLIRNLDRLLTDASPDVRRYALDSAGKLKRKEHVPALVQCLTDPSTGADAASALEKYGPKIAGTLGDYLRDPEEDMALRKAVASALARISRQEAVDILIQGLEEEHQELDTEITEALDKIRSENSEVRFPEEAVRKKIVQEIQSHCRGLLEFHKPGPVGKGNQPAEEILSHPDALRMNIFKLLGLIYPRNDMAKAFQNIQTGTKDSIDYAVELLDNALSKDMKNLLFLLIEDLPAKEKAKRCRSLLKKRGGTRTVLS